MTPWLDLAIVAGFIVALFGIPTLIYFGWKRSAARMDVDTDAILDAAATSSLGPDDPPVHVRFHMYTGVLVMARQTRIERTLPASAAGFALRELMWLNVRNVRRYPGAFWVPLLTWLEYRGQLRSIHRQVLLATHNSSTFRP